MSVQELAIRRFNNGLEANPIGSVIVNADCIFEDGKFIMKSIPSNLPELFTIRFTAPADFTQGNTIEIYGITMPLRVPAMINASSGLFKAGAVFHIDVDMDRKVAFSWHNNYASGQATGTIPDFSYDEQPAGFHFLDGKPVYVKTVVFESVKSMVFVTGSSYIYDGYHGIENIDTCVDMKVIIQNEHGSDFDSFYRNANWSVWSRFKKTQIQIQTTKNHMDDKIIARLYYTCTDR